jgi:hypothetical protein
MHVHDIRNGGYFVEYQNGIPLEPIKNTLVEQGAKWFLQTMFRGEDVLPDTYYLGLTNATYSFTSALSVLTAGEPSGNGYVRQALNRDTTDWTVQVVNGVMQALSKVVTFTASANWDKSWQRAFICDVETGDTGNIIAVSGPAPTARTVLSGAGPSVQYQYFLRG